MRLHPKGFTLVELMVVVAIIVVLISLLLPAMEGAMTQAQIARCATNMDAIATGAVTYALDNKGELFICRARGITIAFARLGDNASAPTAGYQNRPEDLRVDWPAALASVGLAASAKTTVGPGLIDNAPSKLWDCPSRTYQSAYEAGKSNSLITTYQYFGGVGNWTNAEGTRESRSPNRLSDGGGGIMLVADFTWQSSSYTWGAGSVTPWIADTPPHRGGPNNRPAGHNQAYLDGSSEWVPADKLIFIHDWWGSGTYDLPLYSFQRDLGGYTPSDAMFLKNNP